MFLTRVCTALAVLLVLGFGAFGTDLGGPVLLAGDPDQKQPEKPAEKDKKDEKALPSAEEQVRQRLKKHEDEIARIRAAMIEECDKEIKKVEETLAKARKDMADTRGNHEAHRKAFQAMTKANHDKIRLTLIRGEIERKIQIGVPSRKVFSEEQRLGIHPGVVGSTLSKQLKLEKDQGVVIQKVDAGSPAAKAGLEVDDILVQIGGKPVPSGLPALRTLLAGLKVGTPVDVVVLRGGKQVTLEGLTMPGTKEEVKKPAPSEGKKPGEKPE